MLKFENWNIILQILTPILAPTQGGKCHIIICIQSHLTTPMSLGSRRALTFVVQTHSHKLGVEVASWNNNANMKICKGCNENLVEDAMQCKHKTHGMLNCTNKHGFRPTPN